jgi:hypothetical protein
MWWVDARRLSAKMSENRGLPVKTRPIKLIDSPRCQRPHIFSPQPNSKFRDDTTPANKPNRMNSKYVPVRALAEVGTDS